MDGFVDLRPAKAQISHFFQIFFTFFLKMWLKNCVPDYQPMAPRTFCDFHVTISPPAAATNQDALRALVLEILAWDEPVAVYCVREMGKSGQHPHYHAYVRYERPMYTSNLKRRILREIMRSGCVGGISDELSAHLVDVRVAKDPDRLLSGYLQKDIRSEVVLSLNVDLEECERRVASRPAPIASLAAARTPIPFSDVGRAVVEFASRSGMVVRHPAELLSVLRDLDTGGYVVLNYAHRYRDIMWQIACLTQDQELLNTLMNPKTRKQRKFEEELAYLYGSELTNPEA